MRCRIFQCRFNVNSREYGKTVGKCNISPTFQNVVVSGVCDFDEDGYPIFRCLNYEKEVIRFNEKTD